MTSKSPMMGGEMFPPSLRKKMLILIHLQNLGQQQNTTKKRSVFNIACSNVVFVNQKCKSTNRYVDIIWVWPRIPVVNEGFGWDSLLKMAHNPGGHWNLGRG